MFSFLLIMIKQAKSSSKSVDISELTNINQLTSINQFNTVEALIFIRYFLFFNNPS